MHDLVLNPATLELRMASPFSAVHAAYRVNAPATGATRTVRGTHFASLVRFTLALCGHSVFPRLGFVFRKAWWAAVDSNHLPPRYQHGALPVELAALGPAGRARPDPRNCESTGSLALTKPGRAYSGA